MSEHTRRTFLAASAGAVAATGLAAAPAAAADSNASVRRFRVIYFNKVDKGGHFAAWEEPALFSTEIRAAFRSLR